jgi:predicted nucleic acid-binding protein
MSSMPAGKAFLDAILVYAQDRDSPAKRRRAREVIAAKGVMQTFKVFEIVRTSPDLIEHAIDCSVLNGVSFWDALIVVAAAASRC